MAAKFWPRTVRHRLLPVLLLLFVPGAAAFHNTGGSGALGFLNQYFLPANAHVSGYAGLLFGIVAPLGIVMLLLYYVLQQVMGDTREVKALSILMALFIIPSGGYKIISNIFLSVFSFGGGYTAAPSVALPWVGAVPSPDPAIALAVISFFVSVFLFSRPWFADSGFQGSELFAATGVALFVWLSVGGGVTLVEFIGWGIFLWLAYEIFESGMEARRREGFLVGLLGLFLFFYLLSSLEFLPDQLQGIAGTVSSLGAIVIVTFLVISIAVLGIIFR